MSRTWRPMLLLVIAMALILAACGDGGGTATGESPGGGSPAEDQQTVAQEGTAAPEVTADTEATAAPEATADTEGTAASSPGADCQVSDLYAGQTLTLVVPFNPGGGYDTYARTMAPMVAEELDATVIVENEPGAGGLLAVNNLAVAGEDAMRIAFIPGVGVSSAAIAGAQGVQFQLDELRYVARVAAQPHAFLVAADAPYESFDDLLAADEFSFATLGPGSAAAVNASVLFDVFEANPNVVAGFDGTGGIFTAILRGDVDAMTIDLDSGLSRVEAGDVKPLLLIGEERSPDLPDTPTAIELAPDESGRELLETHNRVLGMGRSIVAPPATSSERVEALRCAFQRVLTDDDNLARFEEQERPINYLSGEELSELASDLVDAPEAYRKLLEGAYE